MRTYFAVIIATFFLGGNSLFGQTTEKKSDSGYIFTTVKKLPATSVKNQFRSSTCWSYSTISFLESELLRMGKDTFDLSDMFPVHKAYPEKAAMFVRFNGKHNFGPGGAAHDVINMIRKYGITPESVYSGQVIDEVNPVHGEMDAVLEADVDAVIKNPNKKLTPVWLEGFNGLLNAYLGAIPEKFTYKGMEYTPQTFADALGLKLDDYVEITSYTHHPFYSKFIIEIPDNWILDEVYNVTMDDMIHIIDYSIMNGYTVAWGADVSEKGFSWKNGVAIVPDKNATEIAGTDKDRWSKMSDTEKDKLLYKFDKIVPEKEITQEMRQKEFDNYQTTDDHGLHITGIANDQHGDKYYIVKNSWGTEGNPYNGYIYVSEAYVKLKTMDLMVNKNAIPEEIRKKLGL
ncbi:MAG: aminopeptidase [Bacteroidales bacterium]|jgi:bleomycin hydrolase|nr:aminopeptidase [Bacteroidales bacterium]